MWEGKINAKAPYYASVTAADDKLYIIMRRAKFVLCR